MSEEIVTYIALLGGGAGIGQILRVLLDWRRGVKADESAAHKDVNSGFQAFADDLREQLDAERARLDTIQDRLDIAVRKRQVAYDYAAQLRQDILDKRPPPPRDWPEGI